MNFYKTKQVALLCLLMGLCGACRVSAQQDVPSLLNYQAVITDADGNGVNDSLTIVFRIYDQAEGGNKLWGSMRKVVVTNGYFDVVLSEGSGSADPDSPDPVYSSLLNAFSIDDQLSTDRYLTFAIEGCGEMSPRQKVRSVPYALMAGDVRRSYKDFKVGESIAVSGESLIEAVGTNRVTASDCLINGASGDDESASSCDSDLTIGGMFASLGALETSDWTKTIFESQPGNGMYEECVISGRSDVAEPDILFKDKLSVFGQYESNQGLYPSSLILTNSPVALMANSETEIESINAKLIKTGSFSADGFMINQFRAEDDDCDVTLYFDSASKGNNNCHRWVSLKSDMNKDIQQIITIPVCKDASWEILKNDGSYSCDVTIMPIGGGQ